MIAALLALILAAGALGASRSAKAQALKNPSGWWLYQNNQWCSPDTAAYTAFAFLPYSGGGWSFVVFYYYWFGQNGEGGWYGEWAVNPVYIYANSWIQPGMQSPVWYYTAPSPNYGITEFAFAYLYWPQGEPGFERYQSNPCQYDNGAPYSPPYTYYYAQTATQAAALAAQKQAQAAAPAPRASELPPGYATHTPGVGFRWNPAVDGPLPKELPEHPKRNGRP